MDKKALKKMTIGVFLGGRSSERAISLKSGTAVLASLKRSGYRAVAIDTQKDLLENIQKGKAQAAFIALHGRWGEDGTVQGLLEMLRIPYTGSGVLASSMAMDKAIMKFICEATKIPTPPYMISYGGKGVQFSVPFVVKPANEGSTIGISMVHEKKDQAAAIREALKYDKKIIIEKFIKGREITVGVVNGAPLPVVEVRPKKGFYDFEAKYTKGMTDYIVPAQTNKAMIKKSQDIALNIYKTFGLAGCARIDMLVDEVSPLVIDINTSPGMTETSLVPKAWAALGRTFDGLVEEILSEASLKI
jgi:D-alanine-D-alanine ligase